MLKKLGTLAIVLCLLSGCASHVCDFCGKKFTGTAYYDSYEPDSTLCEDCARQYYAPLPYKSFKK